jgi:hypothetical protein
MKKILRIVFGIALFFFGMQLCVWATGTENYIIGAIQYIMGLGVGVVGVDKMFPQILGK